MQKLTKKGSIFVYLLILIGISLTIGYVILNNTYILNNNINIGKKSEEIFSNIYEKGNINIQTVNEFNQNGDGYVDIISCPTNITMSGTYSTGSLYDSGISTNMVFEDGSIFCKGSYYGDEIRIYYNGDFTDFIKAYYDWGTGSDIVDLDSPLKSSTGNILAETGVEVDATGGGNPENVMDGDPLTEYESIKTKDAYIKFKLDKPYHIGKIVIVKEANKNSKYWNAGKIRFFDSTDTEITNAKIGLAGMRRTDYYEKELDNSGLLTEVQYIQISSNSAKRILDILDVYVYEQIVTGSGGLEVTVDSPDDYMWKGVRTFNDSDLTHVEFTAHGVGGGDFIDDNFNSDDYRILSDVDTSTAYFEGFYDDDVVPRKVIFGNIQPNTEYRNIFWNNYKTNSFIEGNTNNNDGLILKIGDISAGYFYLDIFNKDGNLYDLKIIEFDSDAYKNEYTLKPINVYSGYGLTSNVGYIQVDGSNNLFLSNVKTGNEFVFDWKNKDYGLFLRNLTDTSLSYRLKGETLSGTGLYINPIDDSKDGIIESMSNDIMVGVDKNYIGETFIIVGSK